MKILALDTATEACSAALYHDGEVIERYQLAPREHSKLILPMMQSLLDEAGFALAEMDALAFGCGPGSFTGVRIATGVVQGAALGCDLPVVPISTLAALAEGVLNHHKVEYAFAALDARMGEVYWGVYHHQQTGSVQLVGEESVTTVDKVLFPSAASGVGVGSGWDVYLEPLSQRLGGQLVGVECECYPTAANIARLAVEAFQEGRAVSADRALPIYLRDKVARKISER